MTPKLICQADHEGVLIGKTLYVRQTMQECLASLLMDRSPWEVSADLAVVDRSLLQNLSFTALGLSGARFAAVLGPSGALWGYFG